MDVSAGGMVPPEIGSSVMKKFLQGLVALALLVSSQAAIAQGVRQGEVAGRNGIIVYGRLADGTFGPLAVTYTTADKGGTLDTGGAAETAIAANASRKIWCIQNDPAEEEVLMVRVGGTASATTGMALEPGRQACGTGLLDTGLVSVFAATTGHRWFGLEGQ